MTKRINKDGSLNYFEVIKKFTIKEDVIVLNICYIMIIFILILISMEKNIEVTQMIFTVCFSFICLSVPFLIYIRTVFFLYKRDFYEKDLKKVKKISKKSFKKLKENMNKLDNSIFMYKGI